MKACILLYHRIAEAPNKEAAKTTLFVHPKHFTFQMALVSRLFRVLTMAEFYERLRQGSLPPRSLTLTFDDATEDFIELALPVLNRFRLPVTLFVVAGKLGQTSDWLSFRGIPPAPLLTDKVLRELPSWVEIGAHSLTHRQFRELSKDELRAEVIDSKAVLEHLLKRPVYWFAYPFGNVMEEAQILVKEAGYSAAFSTRRGWVTPQEDFMALPRLAVPYWVGRVGFLLWLRLAPNWQRRVK